MALPPQNIKITYGGYAIGRDSEDEYVIVEGYNVRTGRLEGDVSFSVLVMGEDTEDLQDRCNAFQEIFRSRRERLIIETDGEVHYDFNPATTINKNTIAECTQEGKQGFSGLTRLFSVTIKVDLPPSEANGRTETSVALATNSAGVRTVTISAQYNSTTGGTAQELMEADFDDYVVSVQDQFADGVEWEFQSENIDSEDILTNQQLTISRVYMEIHHRASITYGAFTIGDGPGGTYRIMQGWNIEMGRLSGTITANVRVVALSAAALNTACVALQNAFRARRNTLSLSYDGVVAQSFSGANIHVNAKSNSTGHDDEYFSGNPDPEGYYKRNYTITVEMDVPPLESNGRTETSVSLGTNAAGIRTVTISAQYNSTSGGTAQSRMEADFDDYVISVQDQFVDGVEWEFVSETIDSEDIINNQQLTITRVYMEIHHRASITYGSFTVGDGEGGSYRIMQGWNIEIGRLTATISANVRVVSASSGGLNSACEALEEAFRAQRKTLELRYDGSVHRTFSGSNINVNAQAHSVGIDDDYFSGNPDPEGLYKRNYSIHIDVDMPPLESNGRTEEAIQVAISPSRLRTITIRVAYNSVEGQGAKALYDADIDTYCDSILAFFGGSDEDYELVSENFDESIPIVDFRFVGTRVYQELVFNQKIGLLNDPEFINFDFSISMTDPAPGDLVPIAIVGSNTASTATLIPRRLTNLTVNITTAVNAEITTDLKAAYVNKIIPYAKQIALSQSGGTVIALVDQAFNPNFTQNTISCTLEFDIAVTGTSQLIESSMTTSTTLLPGKTLIGAHDGKKFTKFKIETKAQRTRIITQRLVQVAPQSVVEPTYRVVPADTGVGWITTQMDDTVKGYRVGTLDCGFHVYELDIVENQEYIEKPATGNQVTTGGGGKFQ